MIWAGLLASGLWLQMGWDGMGWLLAITKTEPPPGVLGLYT